MKKLAFVLFIVIAFIQFTPQANACIPGQELNNNLSRQSFFRPTGNRQIKNHQTYNKPFEKAPANALPNHTPMHMRFYLRVMHYYYRYTKLSYNIRPDQIKLYF